MKSEATFQARVLHPLRVWLKVEQLRLLNFFTELRRHPSALAGGVVILFYVFLALLAPTLSRHDPVIGDLSLRLLPPAWQAGGDSDYLLGTDAQGRDILSRIITGSRVSLLVGFSTVGVSVVVGTALGAMAGYYRGRLDSLLSRLADLLMAFPMLIFAIGVMSFMQPGINNLVLALSFKSWVEFFRLARGEMLAEKTREYVEAARVVGQSDRAIIVSEILPNIYHSIMVLATLRIGFMIIMEASLSFLGLGVQPHVPAWGSMVNEGRNYIMTHWWVSTLPGLAIMTLVLAINLFGEGLRDILDPRLQLE
jgi:ABC-type dipeptide/oligopeptide/nickel transport system permease subunit